MYKLYIINPYDTATQYATIGAVSLETNGVNKIDLTASLNEPYQLVLEVNTRFSYWEELKNNRDLGIRLETDYFNVAFIQYDRKQEINGIQKFVFVSSIFKINQNFPRKLDNSYTGSLDTYLASFDPDFVFTPISQDTDIVIETGTTRPIELLTEAISQGSGYSWRENGLKDVAGILKTEILYGNFKDIGQHYISTGETQSEGLEFSQKALIDDIYNLNSASLDYINENDSGDTFKYLLAIGNTGQGGGAENSRILFDDINASFIDPQYPLISQINPANNKEYLFVYNPNYTMSRDTYRVVNFDLSSNTEGDAAISLDDAKQQLYNQARNLIRRTNLVRRLSFGATSKRLVLPGNIAKIKYKEVIEQIDGSFIPTYNIDEEYILDGLTFDLTQITN